MDRINKRLAIGLALSLSINLFVGGFVVARRVLMHRGFAAHAPMLEPRGFLGRAGLGSSGPRVQRVLELERGTLREQHGALRAARAKVRAALEAEPFDKTQLESALQELHAQTSQVQSTMHRTLVEIATSLDAAQRKHLANAPWLLYGSRQR
jgi:uncharacterized membrane protein